MKIEGRYVGNSHILHRKEDLGDYWHTHLAKPLVKMAGLSEGDWVEVTIEKIKEPCPTTANKA